MSASDDSHAVRRLAVVGASRLGNALVRALREPGRLSLTPLEVVGPLGRGADGRGCDAVLLCVPDDQIATAAASVAPGPLVGHCSGATGLEPLAPHEGFSLHPLMTVTRAGADFRGATAAVDGETEFALRFAMELAASLGLKAVRLAPTDRAAYHAAASIASNFVVTLEAAAERLALTAGIDRHALVPLVRATVENWAKLGVRDALTGPAARGDWTTVARQRAAVADRAPELLELFDTLTGATSVLAADTTSSQDTASRQHTTSSRHARTRPDATAHTGARSAAA